MALNALPQFLEVSIISQSVSLPSPGRSGCRWGMQKFVSAPVPAILIISKTTGPEPLAQANMSTPRHGFPLVARSEESGAVPNWARMRGSTVARLAAKWPRNARCLMGNYFCHLELTCGVCALCRLYRGETRPLFRGCSTGGEQKEMMLGKDKSLYLHTPVPGGFSENYCTRFRQYLGTGDHEKVTPLGILSLALPKKKLLLTVFRKDLNTPYISSPKVPPSPGPTSVWTPLPPNSIPPTAHNARRGENSLGNCAKFQIQMQTE